MKRGNDAYVWHVHSRFATIEKRLPGAQFFHWGDRSLVHSSCLAFSLTFNPSRFPLIESWELLPDFINSFLSWLRSAYGSIAVARVDESHLSGYPHVHLIVLFRHYSFDCFPWIAKRGSNRGKLSYRVQSKRRMASHWAGGNIDVFGMASLKAGFHYGKKYLLKSVSSSVPGSKARSVSASEFDSLSDSAKKHLLTLALGWVFRSRSFSLSGDWGLSLDLNTGVMYNSKPADCFPLVAQGPCIVRWSLSGYYRGDNVLLESSCGVLSHSDFCLLIRDPHYERRDRASDRSF